MGKDMLIVLCLGTLLSELVQLVSAGEEQRITETEVRVVLNTEQKDDFFFFSRQHACQILPFVISVLHSRDGNGNESRRFHH